MAGPASTDPNVFILPDLGEGVHEAELISWKVKPGDHVEEHQVVAEMETDKALVEVPSPRDGVIKELFGNVGDILKVGSPAWTYEGEGGAATPPEKRAEQQAPAPQPAPSNGQAASAKQPAAEQEEREDAGTVVGTMSGELGGVSAKDGKALATPAVRRLARDLGVDIDRVSGTGLAGRVTEKDVRAAANGGGATAPVAQPATPQPTPQPQPTQRRESIATTVQQREQVIDVSSRDHAALVPAPESGRIAFRGVRRTIANRLRQSVDTAVHFTVMDDADVAALDDVRKRVAAASGEKLSYLPFVASAAMRALRDFPQLNATVDDQNEEIVRHSTCHLGIAADTEHGLTVPVIPNADMLGVLELGRHIEELARMTRDRTIPQDRLKGSTFTISNVGSYAGKYATPIINYPEVGILACGRVYEGVVAERGAIKVAKLMPLSLTCDHRAVDGAAAARCLARIKEFLGRPEDLLTPARLA
ncbi:MAG: pyruvate dehydrogenase complex dihydrolipoyllysine-residue acetyltransferase [Phycisphaerales bacterium]